jgi:probable O-glycosylation ligase (exosortase A-associated)
MKGLILTYLVTWTGAAAALRYPLIGLYVYVGLAVLRPQFIFGWAGDLSGMSLIVGAAVIVGWALRGFGSWHFGRARGVVLALLLFTAWFVLSSSQALDPSRSWPFFVELLKLVLPFLAGVTLMQSEKDWRPMLWTIVLAQGYVGLEMNIDYLFKGFNMAANGFGGMDNNCFAVSLVTVLGPALALMISSRTWWTRGLAALAAALILHTTLLTFSRGGMVGLLAVGVVAFVMMPKRPKYLAALALTVLVTLRFVGPQLADRYATAFVPAQERDSSAESRIDLWRDCILVIEQYPILGVGPANWGTVSVNYGWSPGKSAHSVWMETAAEVGLPAALILLAFFGLAAIKLWPIAREKITDENRYRVVLASGTILAIVGFAVSGQFVSVPGLEVPYYIVMVAAVMLKLPAERAAVSVPAPKAARSPAVLPRFAWSAARPRVTARTAPGPSRGSAS